MAYLLCFASAAGTAPTGAQPSSAFGAGASGSTAESALQRGTANAPSWGRPGQAASGAWQPSGARTMNSAFDNAPAAANAKRSPAVVATIKAGALHARTGALTTPIRRTAQHDHQALVDQQNRLADELWHDRSTQGAARLATPAGPGVPSPTSNRATVVATAGPKLFGIHSVNGRTTNVHLVAGGKVVIGGVGFGEARAAPSRVEAGHIGGFSATPVSARLVSDAFHGQFVPVRIEWFGPTQIDAVIPATTRGVPDAANALLEVRMSDGGTFRFAGISFTAAREEIAVSDPKKIAEFVEWIVSNSQWRGEGRIGGLRLLEGTSLNCPSIGTDTIHFHVVRGFEVLGASITFGRLDSGDDDKDGRPGSRVFSGSYGFGDWRNQDLPVNWGVFRSHTSPRTYLGNGMDDKSRFVDDAFFNSMGLAVFAVSAPIAAVAAIFNGIASPIHTTDPWDICESGWALTGLTLWGPAGVSP